MSEFAKKLKELRAGANYTQSTLAKALGLSKSSITSYEIGKAVPSDKTLDKMASLFGVKKSDLAAGTKAEEAAPDKKEAAPKALAGTAGKPAKEKEAEKKQARKPAAKASAKASKKQENAKAGKPVKKAAGSASGKQPEKKHLSVVIQSVLGGSIDVEEIMERVRKAAPDAEKVYIKSEENKAFWVSRTSSGSITLWE